MKVRNPDIDWRDGFCQCGSTPGRYLGKGSREEE